MIKVILTPTQIKSVGNKDKEILEYFGRVNSDSSEISIAKMNSPEGWIEPAQSPEFDEYTFVLKGTLKITTKDKEIFLTEGQAILTGKNELVQYSTPFEGGAEYIAICLPAFSPTLVNREI